jgi:hypothetical protein
MAFTVIQGLASNGVARAYSSVTTYTDNFTLTSTPTVGNFVTVALYSNQGNPSASNIQSVTLGATGGGSVTMYLLDDGIGNNGGPFLLLYGAYISTAPNGGFLVVKWKNQTGLTATLSLAAMEFSGASSVSTPANAVQHRYANGLVDSGSPGLVGAALGGYLSYSGNGSVLTISGSWLGGPIPIVGSYLTIKSSSVSTLNAVPMLVLSVSGPTVTVLSSYNGTATENNTVQFYGSIVEQTNSVSANGGSQYPTFSLGILSWPGTSRIMTSYSAQKQPWIGAFYQPATTSGTRIRMGSAGCTIPTSGSFTIPVASTTGASATGKLILHTQNGNIVVTYTSVTASTSFNGCTVNTYPTVATTVAGYSYLTYPTSTTQALLGVFPDASVYNPSVLGGLTNGDSSPTSTSVAPYYAVTLASGGIVTGSLVLMGGYATSGTYANINAIGQVNGTATSNGPQGGIWTFVPSGRVLTPENASAVRGFASSTLRVVAWTRVGRAVQVASSKFARTIAWTKVGRAVFTQAGRLTKGLGLLALIVQIGASRINRTRNYGRLGSAGTSYAVKTAKSRTWVRRASAVVVGLASAFETFISQTHPGTVVVSAETANVVGSFKTANVTFDTETATLYANVKPLQES